MSSTEDTATETDSPIPAFDDNEKDVVPAFDDVAKIHAEESDSHNVDDTEAVVVAAAAAAAAAVADNIDNDEDPPRKFMKSDDHTKVVARHYNKLEEKGLAERSKSRIFYMRNFNNWIKSNLINEYLGKVKSSLKLGEPLRVLDMCCGKGGDLLKWEKGNITHLICTDIAEISIEQCEERYKTMLERSQRQKFNKPFTAEFFACDSTLHRLREKYKDPSIELNMVSCQFAFHYCFESLKQAECMIRNAAECLRTGGYFIGTIPDANDIMKRLRNSEGNSFGNELYKITFLCDTESPPLFGAKYNFELDGVVNCPEFLVHFPLLVKLARKFGLELVLKERFEDYFDQNVESSKMLLERMQALETYPSNRGDRESKQMEESGEYEHVQKLFGSPKKDRFQRYGTLSKSEWEAACTYTIGLGESNKFNLFSLQSDFIFSSQNISISSCSSLSGVCIPENEEGIQ